MKGYSPMIYDLVRAAPEPRIASLPESEAEVSIATTCTIAAHLYRGHYYPGSHPRVDDPTACLIRIEGDAIRFSLVMNEPDLPVILRELKKRRSEPFFQEEFVALNFIDAENRLVQAGVKADGRAVLQVDGRAVKTPGSFARVTCEKRRWLAEIRLPLKHLGRTRASLGTEPVPFDLVRHHAGMAAITAWCPIPDSLPFDETYAFPVFCFGLLGAGRLLWNHWMPKRPDAGRARLDLPKRVEAGTYLRSTLEYTTGSHGLAPGGAIKLHLTNEVIECDRRAKIIRHVPEKDWSALQWENPEAPGYVAVECGAKGARFRLERNDPISITARFTGQSPLRKGTRVAIRFGADPRGPGHRAQLLKQDSVPAKIQVDALGNGVFLPVTPYPTIEVIGGPAHRLLVHASPTPNPGERFRVVLVAVDGYGNIADGYRGTVRLHAPVTLKGLPGTIRFNAADRGTLTLTVSTRNNAAFAIDAVDTRNSALAGRSNLIVTDGSFGPERIVFGDTHTHSRNSDGRLPPPEKVREVALHRGCDFWALTDHCHDMTPERIALWETTLEAADEPGCFVTLPAYEWTCSMGQGRPWVRTADGHRNVYFRSPVATIPDGVARASNGVKKLYKALKQTGVDFFLVNHFHCGDPTHRPELEGAFEVSGWCGSSVKERTDYRNHLRGQYNLQDVYGLGKPVAVMAGSDHGTEAYYAGLPAELTAARVKEFTRDGVFDALRNGACYATSGQPTLLRFTVNGKAPHEHAKPVRSKRRRIGIVVGSAMPVIQTVLVRNGKEIATFPGFDFGVKRFEHVDTDVPLKRGYYYIRVHTAQGHTAWSTPVFFGGK
jgi:hypothetical protein